MRDPKGSTDRQGSNRGSTRIVKEFGLIDAVFDKRPEAGDFHEALGPRQDRQQAGLGRGQPDAVLKVNLDSGEVTGRVETGKVPDGIAVAGV